MLITFHIPLESPMSRRFTPNMTTNQREKGPNKAQLHISLDASQQVSKDSNTCMMMEKEENK
ncbi:hypothetical protein Hanom_Chr03g00270171 [Helianthus anomalus]